MRLFRWTLLFAFVLLHAGSFNSAAHAQGAAQVSASATNSRFAPLDRWTAAVRAGDKSKLRDLYPSGPGAFVQTPEGKRPDLAAEEADFWSGLSSQGLTGIVTKVLARTPSDSGATQFVLRVELTFHSGNDAHRSLVVVRQQWAAQNGAPRITATTRGDLEPLPTITLPQPVVPNTQLYPDPVDAQVEIDSALASAKKDHKRVLVIFGANWCYDCHVLDATLRSARVAPLVAANYHVIHINIGDGDRNGDLADRFEVPLKKGIPSLAVLDSSGQLVTSQKQGEFESAAKIGMSDVTQFLNRWKPAPVAPAKAAPAKAVPAQTVPAQTVKDS
jgi:thioredoxin 1